MGFNSAFKLICKIFNITFSLKYQDILKKIISRKISVFAPTNMLSLKLEVWQDSMSASDFNITLKLH